MEELFFIPGVSMFKGYANVMFMKTKKQEQNSREWANSEFNGADLGDKRLDRCLVMYTPNIVAIP